MIQLKTYHYINYYSKLPYAISLGIAGILILLLGENPFIIFWLFINGSAGNLQNIGNTLFYATPLIFTGLSVALAFRAGLFNIGAEGQLYWGAFAAFWVATQTASFYAPLAIICVVLGSFIAGGLWGVIPGYLKTRFGSHEVISTIMMNFIAIAIFNYLVTGPFHAPGDQIPQSFFIPETAYLSHPGIWLQELGISGLEGAPLNSSFVLALCMSVALQFFLWRTVWGYEVRATGLNPKAARASGIPVGLVTSLTMGLSGGIAGLAGLNEVCGYRHQLLDSFSPGYGFTGIAVALLGRNHPLGVVLSALFFGAMTQGGFIVDIYSDSISKDVVYVIQGLLIISVISEGYIKQIYGK